MNPKNYNTVHFYSAEIPGDWEVKKLGDFVDKIVGGGTPSRNKTDYWNGNIFWATVKDMTSFNPESTEETGDNYPWKCFCPECPCHLAVIGLGYPTIE